MFLLKVVFLMQSIFVKFHGLKIRTTCTLYHWPFELIACNCDLYFAQHIFMFWYIYINNFFCGCSVYYFSFYCNLTNLSWLHVKTADHHLCVETFKKRFWGIFQVFPHEKINRCLTDIFKI